MLYLKSYPLPIRKISLQSDDISSSQLKFSAPAVISITIISKRSKEQKHKQKPTKITTMSCLSTFHYIARASLTDKSSSSSSSSITNPKSPMPETKPTKLPTKSKNHQQLPMQKQKYKSRQQQQLSIMQIERAIGAGTFRDAEPKDLEEKDIEYNGILPDFSDVFDGPVQKQLRQTGEWVANNTEEKLRSSRKGILMLVFKWILPIWTLSLLVASGAIKLPFLDDLIM
ncbi:Chlororespiratory reduction 3 [Melia azedarach]|uniref:Chlororespiratory reduction 3 n=1 Tax=Melia azedarach TaxID=155640 RepID=A0ACC1XF33_MELAZ|nr:Chlororespiratory reduction 3 [Melia azedarach]